MDACLDARGVLGIARDGQQPTHCIEPTALLIRNQYEHSLCGTASISATGPMVLRHRWHGSEQAKYQQRALMLCQAVHFGHNLDDGKLVDERISPKAGVKGLWPV